MLTNDKIEELFQTAIDYTYVDCASDKDFRNAFRELCVRLIEANNAPAAPSPTADIDERALRILKENYGGAIVDSGAHVIANRVTCIKLLRQSYGRSGQGTMTCGLLEAKNAIDRAMIPFLKEQLVEAERKVSVIQEKLAGERWRRA